MRVRLWLLQQRVASPRVNGYLVKASSNPLLFFDSPLPGVNTPWDVMRIVCHPELMDIMLLRWFFDAASSWFKVSQSASIVFVFLLLLVVALAAAHSQVSILKLTSEDLSRNLKLTGLEDLSRVRPTQRIGHMEKDCRVRLQGA
ncbi:hypothetical protein Tco_0715246, partial [Tanacetum coccineum]